VPKIIKLIHCLFNLKTKFHSMGGSTTIKASDPHPSAQQEMVKLHKLD